MVSLFMLHVVTVSFKSFLWCTLFTCPSIRQMFSQMLPHSFLAHESFCAASPCARDFSFICVHFQMVIQFPWILTLFFTCITLERQFVMSLCLVISSILGGKLFSALAATKLEFLMFFFHMNVHVMLCVNCLFTKRTNNFFHSLDLFLNSMFLNFEFSFLSRYFFCLYVILIVCTVI